MSDLAYYQDLARSVVAGRKLIIPGGVLARAGPRAAFLRTLGAERPFILASGRGTGPMPSPEDAECFSLEIRAPDVITEIRETERALRELPDDALAALDAYDPSREAIVLATPFTDTPDLAGRPVYGRRPSDWVMALEDKVVVDEIWDAAGVTREPSEVVPAKPEPMREASRRVDRGDGTVWAGDAREGFNGGAEYLRFIRRPDDLPEAESFFEAHCDRVRVMLFLDGVPCSIHGFVLRDVVIAFRPIENVTLRTPSNRLHYAGVASFWDPPQADREYMRRIARRVGQLIAERVGYRGGFTIDGILTEDGFRPTELNARFGAGTGPLLGMLPLPLQLLNLIAIEDPAADLRLADLERLVVEHSDANRGGACYTVTDGERTETESHAVVERDGSYQLAQEGEEPDGTVSVGPSGMGAFVTFSAEASKVPAGPPFAPRAVRVFAFTDAQFGTGLGPLEAAGDVRR